MQEIWYVFKDDKLLLCRSSEPRLLPSCDVGALSGLLINKGTVVIGDRGTVIIYFAWPVVAGWSLHNLITEKFVPPVGQSFILP